MRHTLLLAAMIAGGPGLACPVAADLDASIAVAFDDGVTEVYRRAGPDLVGVEGRVDGVVQYRMQLARGVHVLRFESVQSGAVVPDSLVLYDYGLEPGALPLPEGAGRWQGDVRATRVTDTVDEHQSQVWAPREPVEIGHCSYDAVEVTTAYATPEGYMEGLAYLPELGFAILAWTRTGDAGSLPVRPLAIDRGK